MSNKSCLVITGEKSGEEHALHCLNSLLNTNSTLENHYKINFYGMGAELLKSKGVDILWDYRDLANWGVSEILKQIPRFICLYRSILKEVKKRNTKYAFLVDYQTFNMFLAKRLKKEGITVFYYVAPQVWAWKAYRAQHLKRDVDYLFCIFPFEKAWFEKRSIHNAISVDHPLLRDLPDKLPERQNKQNKKRNCFKILLLPGSRSFEIKNNLGVFLKTISELKKEFSIQTGLVRVESVKRNVYHKHFNYIDRVYESADLKNIINDYDMALASSGTVTLLTGLYQLPTIVCYKVSLLNEFIFNHFVNYKGPISLTNIIMEENIFPELLQSEANSFNIKKILKKWLLNPHELQVKVEKLGLLKDKLKAGDDKVEAILTQVLMRA